MEIVLSSEADAEVVRVIGAGLNAFNDAAVGYADRVPLTVSLREDGSVVGGVTGRTSLGLLFVDLVYVPQGLRGSGAGRRMMGMVEQEARRRGCRAGVVFTASFQAPGFYERLGWTKFGEVACDPPGTSRVWFSKLL